MVRTRTVSKRPGLGNFTRVTWSYITKLDHWERWLFVRIHDELFTNFLRYYWSSVNGRIRPTAVNDRCKQHVKALMLGVVDSVVILSASRRSPQGFAPQRQNKLHRIHTYNNLTFRKHFDSSGHSDQQGRVCRRLCADNEVINKGGL